MSKIYPNQESTTSSQSHVDQCLNKREKYTLWMKSLVLHSNGCTVYDSSGKIVYRVDNYDRKGGREVNLMNLKGNVVCNIKKRLLSFGCWEGHKYCTSNSDSRSHQEQPWFQVKRCLTGKTACEIKVGSQNLCIERMSIGKSFGFRIVNKNGEMIAEAKQKESSSGIVLSNDVLTLDLEGGTDHSLIMALITVYGLICEKM
ncbi:protein LURP-one-related 4 [Lathyrus oleraceus]|uniref:Uncharacterized protein n=1 Tax=Pisum sativum TaxID=3888 RepID=A0A9D4ZVC1_PEA|nr:protein LURP-one-related 4-like [Pisum sativum]KAI5383750.1 hypothetical protein KIW84_070926 [Pisum sativum]